MSLRRKLLALVLVLSMVAAACGDGETDTTEAPATTAAPTTTAAPDEPSTLR